MRSWLVTVVIASVFTVACPSLASRLDESKAAAEVACAPGYKPCLQVRADLDCSQIPEALKPVRVTGADQYELDRDRGGFGCVVEGQGGGGRSPFGLVLQKPPGKEAKTARAGDVLWVVGWAPAAAKGDMYQFCVRSSNGVECQESNRYVLEGTVQTFGAWTVWRDEGVRGVFKLSLKVNNTLRAFDTVPFR